MDPEFNKLTMSLIKDKQKAKLQAFEEGKRVGREESYQRWVEISRHTNQRRILYPICYLFGHKIDVLTRFCRRCYIAEEKLIL